MVKISKFKKYVLFKFLILFTIFFASLYAVSALSIDYIDPNVNILSLIQLCSIENNMDLACNTLIDFSIINETNSDKLLGISESNQVRFDNHSISLCILGNPSTYDYISFNVTCRDDSSIYGNSHYQKYSGSLDLIINSSKLIQPRNTLQFNYKIYGFVMKDPLYNTFFFNTYGLPNSTFMTRTINLPKDSAIESLYNFKIIATNDNRWVLQVDRPEESMISYRDMDKEKQFSISWEFSLLLLGVGFTVLFSLIQLYLHKDNIMNNFGWFIFAMGCISIGLSGIYFSQNYLLIGVVLFIVGAIIFSLTWKKITPDEKLKKLELLLKEEKMIDGIGKKTLNKINDYFTK